MPGLRHRRTSHFTIGTAGKCRAAEMVCWGGCARDMELAKFEAFLKQHETLDISALVRGSQRLAYPIKGCVRAVEAQVFCCDAAPRRSRTLI